MNWVKGFALVTCLATPLSVITATVASADPAAAPAATTPAASAPDAKPAASDADKRAKAADCSKQADAKGLHGKERMKFRAACKRK